MANYYVDSDLGNDNNLGTITAPWKTLQRSVNDLNPGDILYLSGTFREKVNFNKNGTASNYISFECWPNKSAVWTALDIISGWEQYGILNGNNVWKSTINSVLPDNKSLVFWNGQPLTIAKYPKQSNLTPFPTFIRATAATDNNGIATYNQTLPNTTANKINFGGNSRWSWQTGNISSITNNNLTFSYIPTEYGDVLSPTIDDPFYIWGAYDLLQPGQYFIDGNAVYIMPYDNNLNPNNATVEIKTRDSLNNPWDNQTSTWGKHYYKFKNIVFFGAVVVMGDASSNWQFSNCRFQYFNYFIECLNGLLSPEYYTDNQVFLGDNLIIENSIFNWFSGSILLIGNNILFKNNSVSDGNLFGVNQSMVGVGSSSRESSNIIINNCSLNRCGRSATGLYNVKNAKIINCEIFDYNRLTNDNGGIYCFGGNQTSFDFGWSEISYNKIYKENAEKYKTGIYLDHGCGQLIVHHNQSTPETINGNPMRLHSPADNVLIYNNTFVNYQNTGNSISLWGYKTMSGVQIKNNIFTRPNYIGILNYENYDLQDAINNQINSQRNLYYTTPPLFVDTNSKDYRLLPSSPAVEAGLLLSPWTDGYSGFAPNIGAIDGVAVITPPPVIVPPPIIEVPPSPPPEPLPPVPLPTTPVVLPPATPPTSPPPEPLPPGLFDPPPPIIPNEPLTPLLPIISPLPVALPLSLLPTANNLLSSGEYQYKNVLTTAIRGVSYPLKIVNGNLSLSTDIDLVKESIFSVLETRPFERIMRPAYGTPDMVFDAISSHEYVLHQIRMSLETQIEDVSFDVSGEIEDTGEMNVTVEWSIDNIPQPPIEYKLQV